jgi:hypothetical protein
VDPAILVVPEYLEDPYLPEYLVFPEPPGVLGNPDLPDLLVLESFVCPESISY